ncbi:helix-turn-helix domain-containing protein [Lentilactobacillus sp. SPB1-3]|uniref:Helix-turn-helix domain-containing protein n=1 Tax=Lentilactobacillus terminaliae TaxID=3003483 RepID=A0ACD5DDM8_9LACO
MKNISEQISATLPHELLDARKRAGLSQKAVAKSIGKTLRQYQRYERGEIIPPIDVAYMLADALQTPLSTLTGIEDFPPYNEVEK